MKFFKNTNASSNVLNEFVYSYNTANQITQITEPTVRTRTFGYDNADRLTTSTSTLPNQNESYTFDDVGNRISSHLSSVYGYQSGSFNRLSSTQQASYSFDNNGNLTSKTEGTAKWYYSYDRENRLMNAAKFGGMMPRANESVNYQYDALGRRVVRQDKKTGRTEFTHDGMDVIQDRFEKNDGNISTTNYVNGIGIDDKLKVTSGTTSRYFLTDHLGSTVGMADTNGNVTESATYDSFGRTISSNLTTRYGFTGREADEKTGLMYYRARQYDPQIGRFTSEDPIGFEGGMNWYAYVNNKPIKHRDPRGLDDADRDWEERFRPVPPNLPVGDNYGERDLYYPLSDPNPLPERLSECAKNWLKKYFPNLNLDNVWIHHGIPGYVPIDAQGYTSNNDIYIKQGHYKPDSAEGLTLIGHELVHTQQYEQYGDVQFKFRYTWKNSINFGYGPDIIYEAEAYNYEKVIHDDLLSRKNQGEIPCGCKEGLKD